MWEALVGTKFPSQTTYPPLLEPELGVTRVPGAGGWGRGIPAWKASLPFAGWDPSVLPWQGIHVVFLGAPSALLGGCWAVVEGSTGQSESAKWGRGSGSRQRGGSYGKMTHSRNWLQPLGGSWRLLGNLLTICQPQTSEKVNMPPLAPHPGSDQETGGKRRSLRNLCGLLMHI